MMIDAKYIDHSGLRNEYSVTPIKEFFEGFYLQDVTMSIGTHTGSVSVRKMERLFAIVSQIQYYLKMSGASMVTWWYVQHILLAYMSYTMATGLQSLDESHCVNPDNYDKFIRVISGYKNSSGQTLFTEKEILQVLQTLYKYRNDQIIRWGWNPVPFLQEHYGRTIGVNVPAQATMVSSGSTSYKWLIPVAVIGGAILLLGKKGKRR